MPVAQRLEDTGLLIKAAVAVVAFFPGLAALFGLVPIPQPIERLVQVISFSVSAAVLIAIPLLDKRIRRTSPEFISILTIVAVILAGAATFTYFRFAETHTVAVAREAPEGEAQQEVLLIPLSPSERIERIIAPYGGDYEEPLHNSNQSPLLRRLMREERGSTTLVIVALLVFAQILLTAPVVAIAWRAAGPRRSRARRPEVSEPTASPESGEAV